MSIPQSSSQAASLDRAPTFDIRFPPLPRSVAEVTQLISEKDRAPDISRLAEIVDTDPVIASSVLRRINSAFYGVRRRVGDVHKAANMLGFEEVCDIVLTSGMLRLQDIIKSGEQTRIFDQIMRMSIGTAGFARRIAAHLTIQHRSSAFTLGLLHTCGRLVLLYNHPGEYEKLWVSNGHGFAPSASSEKVIFGRDHAELGARAVETWNLPDELVQTIRVYLTPGHLEDQNLRVLALTLSVSAHACERLCLDPVDFEAELSPSAALFMLARATGTDADDIRRLIESCRQEVSAFTHSMTADL